MQANHWYFPSGKSRVALQLADTCLVIALLCGLYLTFSLSLLIWLFLAVCCSLRVYFKIECWSFCFVMSGAGTGFTLNGEEAIRFLRPALTTPYCIWFLLKTNKKRPQWIILWKDQFHPRNWRRLRRIAHDLNH